MVKKIVMIVAAVFITIGALCIYGVYQFLHPFGELVSEELSDSYFYTKDNNNIVYSPMGNWFSLGKDEMSVDMTTFKVLGRTYAKDKKHAYFAHTLMDIEVDIASFTVKYRNVPMDKNHVYLLLDEYYYFDEGRKGFKIIEDADPETYVTLNSYFAKDKKNIFWNNEKLTEVDHKSFEILTDYFCKDRNGIYYYWKEKPLIPVGANHSEVVVLTSSVIRDNAYIYIYKDSRIEGEIDRFFKIPFKNSNEISFFKDADLMKVDGLMYYEAQLLEKADGYTFKEIGNGYAKDISSSFYQGKIIEEADVKTFENFIRGYAKDATHVFYQGKVVKGADVATFKENKNNTFFYDKNHRYLEGEIRDDFGK